MTYKIKLTVEQSKEYDDIVHRHPYTTVDEYLTYLRFSEMVNLMKKCTDGKPHIDTCGQCRYKDMCIHQDRFGDYMDRVRRGEEK